MKSLFLLTKFSSQLSLKSFFPVTKKLLSFRPASNHPTLTQSEQLSQFMELFSNLLNDLSTSYDTIFIFGDLNIDILKFNSCKNTSEYIDLLFSFGLIQTVTKPSRCTINSATLIDHCIIKWMSKGILISRLTKIKLGKLCHSSPSAESTAKFKLYRNLFNIVVRNAKKLYYEKTLAKVQSNLKKTWSVHNSAMNKNASKSSCIESLCVDGVIESDPKKIG